MTSVLFPLSRLKTSLVSAILAVSKVLLIVEMQIQQGYPDREGDAVLYAKTVALKKEVQALQKKLEKKELHE